MPLANHVPVNNFTEIEQKARSQKGV